MRTGLLLGNGLFRCSEPDLQRQINWWSLICDLAFRLRTDIRMNVPLTLEFDRLVLHVHQQKDRLKKLYNIDGYNDIFKQIISSDDVLFGIKRYIAGRFNELSDSIPKLLSQLFTKCPECILTTNYDLRIENALCHLSRKKLDRASKDFQKAECLESTISINGVEVYHCHGTIDSPHSICLGYMDYAKNIAAIDKIFDSLEVGDISQSDSLWPLRFLDTDIFILGLELDFSETDLWHLLYRRAVHLLKNNKRPNKIMYIDASPRATDIKDGARIARKSQMESLGVKVINIIGQDYSECYERAINAIHDEWSGCWEH